MSRKHFVAIAAELLVLVNAAKESKDQVMLEHLNTTVAALCDVFAGCNSRFNRQRFFQACGL
jgi:hypothetical protein